MKRRAKPPKARAPTPEEALRAEVRARLGRWHFEYDRHVAPGEILMGQDGHAALTEFIAGVLEEMSHPVCCASFAGKVRTVPLMIREADWHQILGVLATVGSGRLPDAEVRAGLRRVVGRLGEFDRGRR